MKIGYGYDVHRFVENRKCILAGENIPYEKGLDGHSDADVVSHAIMDALLGASALPDIGTLFPDTNSQYKNADSLQLLKEVIKKIKKIGYEIENIDTTVVAQKPKLQPYIKKMRENIAHTCGIDIDQINIKATTEEGLGFTGTLQGISTHAVCLLRNRIGGDLNEKCC